MGNNHSCDYDYKIAIATSKICSEITCNQQAAALIFKMRQSIGDLTCKCAISQFVLRDDDRTAQCATCKTIVTTTKGTVMEQCSELLAWLVAIKLYEQGLTISASRLARLALTTTSCADSIVKKLLVVIANEMPQETLLVSAHRFKKIISRRSTDSPRAEHPYVEQILIEKEHEIRLEKSLDKGLTAVLDLPEKQVKILALLSEKPLSLDALYQQLSAQTTMPVGEFNSNLTMLELGNYARQLNDGKFVRAEEELEVDSSLKERLLGHSEQALQSHIDQIIEFIHFRFQSVSRKFLQLFLGAFWCHNDRKKWGKDALLLACLKHPPVNQGEIAAHSSPPLIKLMPFPPLNDQLF